MKRLYIDHTNEIIRMFDEMKNEKKIELLVTLYFSLGDYTKTRFLRKIENA